MNQNSVCSVAKSYTTLGHPKDRGPPGSSVHVIFQSRILEWVVISSSRRSSLPRDQIHISFIDRQILYHWAPWEAHQNSTQGKNEYASILACRNTHKNNMGFQLSFSNLIICYFWISHLDPVVILDDTLRFISILGHKTLETQGTCCYSSFLKIPELPILAHWMCLNTQRPLLLK